MFFLYEMLSKTRSCTRIPTNSTTKKSEEQAQRKKKKEEEQEHKQHAKEIKTQQMRAQMPEWKKFLLERGVKIEDVVGGIVSLDTLLSTAATWATDPSYVFQYSGPMAAAHAREGANNLKGLLPTLITQQEIEQTTSATTHTVSTQNTQTLTIEQQIQALELKHHQEIETLKQQLKKDQQLKMLQSQLRPQLSQLCQLGADQLSPEQLYELLHQVSQDLHNTSSASSQSSPSNITASIDWIQRSSPCPSRGSVNFLMN